jgi:hypothetical protein
MGDMTDESVSGGEVAMQVHCVACLREQWAPAVFEVSFGMRPCAWCGHTSTMLGEEEYRAVLRQRYQDVADRADEDDG